MTTRRMTNIAMLSCLSFVGRIMFAFLPNFQPTTTIIIIITMYFGLSDGLLVATISMLMSNLYLGMGIWTMAQIVSYAFVVIGVHFLMKLKIRKSYFSVISLLLGLFYGFVISLVQAPFFGWNIFIPYYVSGIPYDISHAVGNYLFFIILHPVLRNILKNQNNKIKQT